MRIYELTVLFEPELSEKDLGKATKDLQGLLGKNGAKIKTNSDPVKRATAYEIGKHRDAFYLYQELEMKPEDISALDEKLKLEDSIIRYLLIRKD